MGYSAGASAGAAAAGSSLGVGAVGAAGLCSGALIVMGLRVKAA